MCIDEDRHYAQTHILPMVITPILYAMLKKEINILFIAVYTSIRKQVSIIIRALKVQHRPKVTSCKKLTKIRKQIYMSIGFVYLNFKAR